MPIACAPYRSTCKEAVPSWNQPWRTSGFRADGTIKPDYLKRLDDVITACDRLGMVVILGLFYWKQTHVLADEAAIRTAVTNSVDWLVARGARNVLLEIGNEVDLPFPHEIIGAARCHELVELAQQRSEGKLATPKRRLLVSTSLAYPPRFGDNLMAVCDFLLPHGNSVHHPDGIGLQVLRNRTASSYRGQPIIYNEDDHYDFDKPDNNMIAAIGEGASWGFSTSQCPREISGWFPVPPCGLDDLKPAEEGLLRSSEGNYRWLICRFRVGPTQAARRLFDHLVDACEQVLRDDEAERFGSPEIDNQLVLRRKLRWQIGGLCAPEDTIDIRHPLPPHLDLVRPVGKQAPAGGEITERINRGKVEA
jgi:hypothetical protein